ncbi:hypothetical protein KKB40_03035, partial [Patescibacteria group bacterium]|nr:hypothetical protein [Patescibacteria group bacterium]
NNKNAQESIKYTPGLLNLALLHLFGLIEVVDDLPKKHEGWRIESIKRTLFGDCMLHALFLAISKHDFFRSANKKLGLLQKDFQVYFPQWKKSFNIDKKKDFAGVVIYSR